MASAASNLRDPEPIILGSVAVPLYFPAQAKRLFGWLHRPVGPSSNVGLVICKPFGYEALCAHRSIRAFALAAASNGIASLIFDYTSTGDSADMDEQQDEIEQWCQDIVDAVVELKRQCGVTHVSLLGFRLGALLASLACTRSTIDALVLIAPVVSGASYLRELRTIQRMATHRAEPRMSINTRTDAAAAGMEVSGYAITAEALAHLQTVNLAAQGRLPVSSMLVIDRSGQPTAAEWTVALAELGVDVTYAPLPGFVDMMMTVPQYTRTPHSMITHTCHWLVNFAVRMACANSERILTGVHADKQMMAVSEVGKSHATAVLERPVRFGPGSLLFGIVAEVACGQKPSGAVVLVNAGAAHHVSVGRLYVTLARRWARSGYVVLRMDLAGLGDSDTRQGRPDNEVYPPAAVDDLRAAVKFLREQYEIGELAMGGVCSGGYHSLRAATADVDVDKIFIVNPDLFFPRRAMGYEDIQVAKRADTAGAGEWNNLRARVANLSKFVTETWFNPIALRVSPVVRSVARRLRIVLPNDLGFEFEQLVARGVQITLVFASGEPGIRLLKLQGGANINRLGDRCRLHIVNHADHTFSHSASRAALVKLLSEALMPNHPASTGSR